MAQSKPPAKPHIVAKVIDGALAGITGVTLTYPIDLAKTRLQNQKNIVPIEGQAPKPLLYRNVFQTIKVVYQQEGLAKLYRGMKVNLMLIPVEKSIKLVSNDMIRLHFTDKKTGKIKVRHEVIAGMSAGFLQSVATSPMEFFKIYGQKASSSSGKSRESLGTVVKTLLKTKGPQGLYQGWSATIIRDLPFSMIYFPLYANISKQKVCGQGKSFWGNLLAGYLAGAISGFAVTPLDMVKTRQQSAALKNVESGKSKPPWAKVLKEVWKEAEGNKKLLFKGAVPRMILIGTFMSIAQAFYELGIGSRILGK